MAEINKQWKNFLTYGGIDGGDSDAKIWFVGIEWANTEDVKKSRNKHTDKIIPDISNEEEIKEWLTADCRLEHRMGIIINAIEQDISPNTGISLTKDLITAGKFFKQTQAMQS